HATAHPALHSFPTRRSSDLPNGVHQGHLTRTGQRARRSPRLPSLEMTDDRPYSPGLEGVIAAESAISIVDGKNGRLLYRGYPIGELVKRGTYAAVADLLWTGEWHPGAQLHPASLSPAVV